jgi:hypothetical protein
MFEINRVFQDNNVSKNLKDKIVFDSIKVFFDTLEDEYDINPY